MHSFSSPRVLDCFQASLVSYRHDLHTQCLNEMHCFASDLRAQSQSSLQGSLAASLCNYLTLSTRPAIRGPRSLELPSISTSRTRSLLNDILGELPATRHTLACMLPVHAMRHKWRVRPRRVVDWGLIQNVRSYEDADTGVSIVHPKGKKSAPS